MPSAGTAVPMAPQISRAVPSPPANSSRSTGSAASARATATVCSAVVCSGNRAARALDREAGLVCGGLAHGAGAGVDADAPGQRREHAQRAHGAGMCAWLGATRARLGHDRHPVAALQPHGAADAGQRIDDEPEPERPAPGQRGRAHGAKPTARSAACTGVPGAAAVPMRQAENSRRCG